MRALRNRLLAVWNVLCGRPTMYRMQTGPLRPMPNVRIVECQIVTNTTSAW